MRNYYKVLGVPKDAHFKKIKEAYQNLSSQYTADKKSGNEMASEMLKMINEAYGTLSDPFRRKIYDHSSESPPQEEASIEMITQDDIQKLIKSEGRFDWVGFTCKFLKNIFIGLLIFLGLCLYKAVVYRGIGDVSLMQWLLILVLPLAFAIYRGYQPGSKYIASPEVKDFKQVDWLAFLLHFIFGFIIGFGYSLILLWITPGLHDETYQGIMPIVYLGGISLLLGTVGGIYQNQLWDPMFKRWFTKKRRDQ